MRTFPLNSHPGHFSRVRQSKNFLISRPCVSCPNNRIFSLRIVNSFLWLFFHTFRPRPHVSGYFWKRTFLCPLSKKTLPLFLDQTEARRAPPKFLDWASPFSPGLVDGPPPPPPYLTVWIHHWVGQTGGKTGLVFKRIRVGVAYQRSYRRKYIRKKFI